MPPRSRLLTDADRAAWQAYIGQIAPLPGRPAPALPASPPDSSLPPRPRLPPFGPAAPPPPRPLAVGEPPGGVDAATWQRFRSGKLTAARKLDLHGMTAHRAFHALVSFVRSAHADRLRCVEVVTGRGSREETGVLRRELPLWLNLPDLRPLVLGAAHPHAANPGSVRLLLRRIR
ncbi:MAG TPA: Smr/MutS family protein [Acetobacteraceae bacterium]|nr:Smr/MutS family protein [Acetobacteraceae bacterium]